MEKEGKNQRPAETEFFLQWGCRKRLRCVRVRGPNPSSSSDATRHRRKISSRFLTLSTKDSTFLPPLTRLTRNSETAGLRSENRRSDSRSPEKKERCYPTRGTAEENGMIAADAGAGNHIGVDNNNRGGVVWPKLYITLSSKEKEEDFMAMKGCKLPQRPKKRAKLIQRTLLLVSPGAWLTDMSLERYEVREKKSTKKRGRGLKAMGSVESDSE